jgi:hypothetical protein
MRDPDAVRTAVRVAVQRIGLGRQYLDLGASVAGAWEA